MRRRTSSRFAISVISVISVLALAACGGGDDSSSSDDDRDSESTEAPRDDDDAANEDESEDGTDATAAPVDAAPTVDILTDFADVCRGVTLAGATPYDPTRTGIHPLMAEAGQDPTYGDTVALLPDTWDPVTGEEQTVELVVCLARTSATLTQTCTGYLDDNEEDTGNAVELYDASYDVRLLAATTGEVVAETQLDATEDTCPSFVFFDADEKVQPSYAIPTDELTAFLAPYIET